MKAIYQILLLITFLALSFPLSAQKMNNKRLGTILEQVSDSLSGELGYWQLFYEEQPIIVITDENHNRMRIISPIAYVKDLEEGMLMAALKANFHTALDVKYAVSEDIMWTVFIHPLKELSEGQVIDAVKQVYQGSVSFGTSYSSTDLVFPGEE